MNPALFCDPVTGVSVSDTFFSPVMETVRTRMLPYQWKALHDEIPGAEPSHCVQNFRIAAELETGEFQGFVFQDSDAAKWIEAAAYSLRQHPDPELEDRADQLIALILQTQQQDGYIGTYYTINGLEKRWTDVTSNHELYCAGHLLEAAIAYAQATGKDRLLQAMTRFVDHIDQVFGPEEGKLHGYPGHEIIEMALLRLYEMAPDPKYLRLARYFIEERGKQPCFFAEEARRQGREYPWKDSPFRFGYYQAAAPVREQKDAVGHAVRAVYLYSGMADAARLTGDDSLYQACRILWDSITQKRMYLTGAIGSSAYGESFTMDYDLPPDLVYGETCASVGLAFFARRMLRMDPDGRYADVLEKVLYNGILSGMSLDGTKFFYVNPLEAYPERNRKVQELRHAKTRRQAWFACACCPPNLARLMESVGDYIYMEREGQLFVHLYIGSRAELRQAVEDTRVEMESRYPWKGDPCLRVESGSDREWTLALHVPAWCRGFRVSIDGKEAEGTVEKGYWKLKRSWKGTHQVRISMEMPPRVVRADPRVRSAIGKIAVMRGPVVYCLEEADNGNDLHCLEMAADATLSEMRRDDLAAGMIGIRAPGRGRNDGLGAQKMTIRRQEG